MLIERFQRCLSRVRTALAMTLMRLGLIRDLRKICQDFSRAMPRSTGARAADRARFAVCSVVVSSPPAQRRTHTHRADGQPSLSAARAPVERGVARLKSWRIFRRARCSPTRLTMIAAAVLTLESQR